MTKRTRILVIFGIVLIVPLLALAILPFVFRDRIVARAKSEINETVDARVDWRDAGLSFFGDFPNLTLSLDQLSVANTGRFAGDTLAKVGTLNVVLDLGSVWRNYRRGEPIIVRSVALDRPVLALRVLEDGTANWDIAKTTPETTADTSSPVAVTLRSLEIRDASVSLDDRQSRLVASLAGYRQSLSGDFAQDVFTIETLAHADSVSLTFAGIPYLTKVMLSLSADINADMRTKTFTFAENELRLNELRLDFSGSTRIGEDRTTLDIAFNAPRTDFKHILSLVPAIYAEDFQSIRTSGAVSVSGNIKGDYGEQAFPSFAVNAKVDNASFQYPDLPLPARDIALDLAVRNPGGDVDSTVVNLDRFHASIGGEAVDGTMVLRTPVSDPDVDLRLAGQLDLADLRRTVKLQGVKELAGRVAADVAVRTRMSWVDQKQYDRVTARGNVNVSGLTVNADDLPHALAIDEARLQLTPQRAELRSLTGRIGSSDLRLSGYLENLVPFALRGDPLRGSATLASRRFDLNEWQSDDDSLEVIPVPGNIDLALDATVDELIYGKLSMTDARGGLRVKDERATLERFTMNTLGGAFSVTGFYETTDVARPTFDVNMQMKSVDIPSAFAALTTVQVLAPVARYARGTVSTDLRLAGALGADMTPLFDVLTGRGSLQTSELVLQGFPVMVRLADVLKIDQLRNPTLDALRASLQIRDGRVHVNPFTVNVGQSLLRVAGSHGIDQSLQYTLGLQLPRSALGADANRVIAGLISRAGRTGVDLQAADSVALDVTVGGTLTNPTIQTNLGDVVASAGEQVKEAVREEVAERVDSAKARADSAAAEARRRAQAEAERLIAEAEQRAAAIRDEAKQLADRVRQEG
ncbi:MAG TPA: AsmA-like C-terminal region-containing protein, partial [Gemmatimonadaceae bacterium]|nr:AsmA-like C-terminal region-containing protein [Gemmatimonadaceae bacterium]